MAVYDFFLSRNSSAVTINDYVGHVGRLFYDDQTGNIRLSDGVSPGGLPVPITLATASSAGAMQPGQGLEVDGLGIEKVKLGEGLDFDEANNIKVTVATTDTIGGIKLGPGVTLNASDQLVIDSEGLDFTFGDFSATSEPGVDSTTSAVLSSINDNEPIVIRARGTGSVSVEGEFNVFPTNGSIGDRDPVFQVNAEGDISATTMDIVNKGNLELMSPLNVSINEQGLTKTPAIVTGSVAQFTGRDDTSSLVVQDHYGLDPTFGTGGQYVFRTARGSNAVPLAVQADDILGRVNAAGWGSTGYGGVAASDIALVANQNFTDTARGGRIELRVIPDDSTTLEKVVTIDETGITLNNSDTGISNTTYITFDTTHIDDHTETGTLCWNASDGTLNLHHLDGVVQQIGQELYAYVINDTGSEIVNGTCVRFDGAILPDGEARLAIAPFQANGVYPSLYGLGIATQTLSDEEEGRVCVWGKVRNIDTTGQDGETWVVGDILYASPAISGGLTKIKPTSPDNVVPVAAVLRVDAANGEIFVRPTIEQRLDYGRFTKTTTINPVVTDTAETITLDTTNSASGISIGTPASRLVVTQSGFYNVALIAQMLGDANSDVTLSMWIRKNGVDIPNSMRRQTTNNIGQYASLSFGIAVSLDADDYIEFVYAVNDTRMTIEAEPATAYGPATSSIEVNLTQVQL